jgi:N-acetylneuraminic acid mutarotase
MITIKFVWAAPEDSWTQMAPMSEARSRLGVAVMNGKIYAIGGQTDSGGFTGTNEEYHPTANMWTFKASLPTPRASFGITVYQNKIYCIGGLAGVEQNPYKRILSAANEIYDPATDTWETKSPMPAPKEGITANMVGSKIYVIGGNSSENLAYDPVTNSWTTKASIPVKPVLYSGWSCTSTVVDDKIHVIGIADISGLPQAFHEIYDPKINRWDSGAPVPSDAYAYTASGATTDAEAPKRIYAFGVDRLFWDLSLPSFATLSYDLENDSWTVGVPMLTGRINAAVAVVNNRLYAIGGSIPLIGMNTAASDVNEQYTPVGYEASIQPSPSPSPIATPPNAGQESFPIALVAAVAVSVVAAIAGLLLYFRKRNH